MANKRITELNLHTSLQLSDVIAIVNSSETKKTTYGSLYNGIRDGLVSGSSQVQIGSVTGFSSYSSSVAANDVELFATASDHETRVDALEAFSSSLDGEFVNNAELAAATAGLETTIDNLTTDNIDEGDNLYYEDYRVKYKLNVEGVISGSSQIILGDVTNFTSYSSSVDSILTNLVNATSSYLTSETDSQTLSIVGDQLSISNGNTVSVPSTDISSLNSFTSSYFIDSSSFDTRLLTEQGRIDTILDGANADYDQFVEIVNLINSVDTTNDNAFASFYTSSNNEFISLQQATASLQYDLTNISASFDTTIGSLTFDQLADVQDYTASEIPNGYLPVWNSSSEEWRPGRPDFEQGKTRLFVAAARSNTASFFFNSQTRTSDTSASPAPDSAFMLVSSDLDTIIVHLRSDTSVNVTIDIFKNADGVAFSSATSTVTPVTRTLTANTITSTTFSGVTINQFDSIHIKVTPSGGGNFYGIVEII